MLEKISLNFLLKIFLISFLLWIFITNISQSFYYSLFLAFFFFVFIFNILIYEKNLKINFIYLVIFLLTFIFGTFISYKNISNINNNLNNLEKYNDNFVHKIIFNIEELNKIKRFEKEYVVKILKIDNKNLEENNIKALISIAKNYNFNKNEQILTNWKIQIITNFNNFNYKKYLLSKNIYSKIFPYSFEKIWTKKENLIIKKIDKLRTKLINIIFQIYPKQEASFLAWILLWARENMEKDLKQNFNNSGLTHFIAVSWFNITLLLVFFGLLFKFFPNFLKIPLIIWIIIIFSILVGFSAPVLRASIMWIIWFLIVSFGRDVEFLSLVLLVAFLIVIFSPFSLNYDVSFALSFLAVLWIVYSQNFLSKVFYFLPKTLAIKEAFILTLWAMSLTLPIIIFNFGQISLLSVLANIAVSWTIWIAMLFGFISIIFYLFSPILAYIVWFIAYIFLAWDIKMVNFFGSLDFFILKFNFWEEKYFLEILYYLIIFFILFYLNKKEDKFL